MDTIFTCKQCKGRVLRDTMQCPHCGSWLSGIECGHCGYVGREDEFIGDHCPSCSRIVQLPNTAKNVETVLTPSGFTTIERTSSPEVNRIAIILGIILAIIALEIGKIVLLGSFL